MGRLAAWGFWATACGALVSGAWACGGDDASSAAPAGDAGATGDSSSGSEGGGGGDDATSGGGDDGSAGGDAGATTPWRYTVVGGPDAIVGALSLARGPNGLEVAYPTTSSVLTVATLSGGTFTSDTATGHTMSSGAPFVVAPDGTPWIAFGGGGASGLTIAHKEGASWIVDTVSGTFDHVALAVAADGTPWIAANGYAPSVTDGVLLVKRNGSSWTVDHAATPPTGKIVMDVGIGVSGGVPQIGWIAQDGSVHLTAPNGGGGYTDTPVGNGQYDGGLAVVVDKDDKLHLAYQANGRDPSLVTNVGGTWQTEMVASDVDSNFVMRLAAAPDGSLAMAWYSNAYGVRVAVRAAGGGWSTQSVFGYCTDESRISISFDASSNLYLAHNCTTPGALWQRGAPYPAGYTTTCAGVAAALCQKAYACCGDGSAQECCISTTQGGNKCANPESYCETVAQTDLCGNATQDPSALDACNAVTGQATCTTTPKNGALAPDACAPFF